MKAIQIIPLLIAGQVFALVYVSSAFLIARVVRRDRDRDGPQVDYAKPFSGNLRDTKNFLGFVFSSGATRGALSGLIWICRVAFVLTGITILALFARVELHI